MKTHHSRIADVMLAGAASLALAGCTYYHTTEQAAAPRAASTVVVPQAARPSAVVIPKPASPDTDTVIVAPDSTVTVTPRPNE